VNLGPLDTAERVERVRRSLAMVHFEAPPVFMNDQVLRMLQAWWTRSPSCGGSGGGAGSRSSA
jgi:hypothetical protein